MNRRSRRAAAKNPIQRMMDQASAALNQGRVDVAAELAGEVLKQHPTDPTANHFFGACLMRIGDLENARAFVTQSIRAKNDYPDAYNTLGIICNRMGDLVTARQAFEATLELRPDHTEARLNLGSMLARDGRLDAAESVLGEAVRRNPQDARAAFMLGTVYLNQFRYDAAAELLGKAVAAPGAEPHWHVFYGSCLDALGRTWEALDQCLRALRHDPSPTNKVTTGRCLGKLRHQRYDAVLSGLYAQAIEERWELHGRLFLSAITMLHHHPDFHGFIMSEACSLADCPPVVFAPGLFRVAIEEDIVNYYFVERALTAFRAAALRAVVETGEVSEPLLPFLCSVAHQCFLNEYVYAVGTEEQRQVDGLRQRLEQVLATGGPILAAELAVLSMYEPLRSLAAAERLAELGGEGVLAGLVRRQVLEPLEEERLRSTISSLGNSGDAVSGAVRRMYEENPYPRWVKTKMVGEQIAVEQFLRQEFPGTALQPLPGGSRQSVLIAGCGTGHQPLTVAGLHRDCDITAIDLSVASLAYALRKTQEAGVGNLDYFQADILALDGWERRFDVVEAAGVLHHMREPMQGWKILADLVKPGGVMKIGLYSRTARRPVTAARQLVREQGWPATPEGIREARQAIFRLPADHPAKPVCYWGDFSSTSRCRDLIFHVQEHQFTIPQISDSLDALGLRFIGFSLERDVLQAYHARFPGDAARNSLANWHQFEQENPTTFERMYQFWVQKPGG